MRKAGEYVIGLHHAMNHTRAICLHRSGKVAALLERTLSHSTPNDDGADNREEMMEKGRQDTIAQIRAIMADLIPEAGVSPENVAAVTAAIMGLEFSQENEWADESTKLPGLLCPRQHVGLVAAAHAGSLSLQPGIAVLAWPSVPPERSIVVAARSENGRVIVNFELGSYPDLSQYDIAVNTINRILCGFICEEDQELVSEILAYWQVKDIPDLIPLVKTPAIRMPPSSDPRLDRMADVIFLHAERGVPLAEFACSRPIVELGRCLRLLAVVFESNSIPVVFTSTLFQLPYMRRQVVHELAKMPLFKIQGPHYSASVGACLLAMDHAGFPVNEAVRDRLNQYASFSVRNVTNPV